MSGYTRAELETGLLEWDVITPREWMPRLRQTFADLKEPGTRSLMKRNTFERMVADGGASPPPPASTRRKESNTSSISPTERRRRKLIKSEERFRRFAEIRRMLFGS